MYDRLQMAPLDANSRFSKDANVEIHFSIALKGRCLFFSLCYFFSYSFERVVELTLGSGENIDLIAIVELPMSASSHASKRDSSVDRDSSVSISIAITTPQIVTRKIVRISSSLTSLKPLVILVAILITKVILSI